MLSFSLAEDVSEHSVLWRVASVRGAVMNVWTRLWCGAVMVGAGHCVTQSRVTTPSPPSVSQQPGQPPVFARRQGKVPIFTHFSGSLIQEFSYSLEFSYSHTLLMNLQWDTFTWPARPRHRPALLHSHHAHMQLKVNSQKLNPKLLFTVRTQGIFGISNLLWCFCNIHLCMCMFHLAPCAMEASLW